MGLLETEIKELRQLNKRHDAGTLKKEDLTAKISIYSQIEKRAKMLLQAHVLELTYGKRFLNKLVATNLIGDSVAIDTETSLELDMVVCIDQDDQLISRGNCLDYSGSTEHVDSCQSCPQFKLTRKTLLPE